MMQRRSFIKGSLAFCAAPFVGGCVTSREDTVSFAMFNDTHENLDTLRILSSHARRKYNFSVLAGDIVNDVRSLDSVRRLLISPMNDLSKRLSAEVHLVRGNHETRGEFAQGLWRELALRDERYYFAKTYGRVHCVFLDTCENRTSERIVSEGRRPFDEYLGEEKSWLEREISSAAWKAAVARIVFMHIPPPVRNVDSTSYERVKVLRSTRAKGVLDLQDCLLKSGVNAVFAGHIHMGSFDSPTSERPYPVIIGGGSRVDRVYPTEPLLTECQIGNKEFVVRQIGLSGDVKREERFKI